MLQSYIRILAEMTVLEEARSILLSSSQCFLEEKSKAEEMSLSILIRILRSNAEIEVKMTILKFLAVLVYSVKSLSMRVKVS